MLIIKYRSAGRYLLYVRRGRGRKSGMKCVEKDMPHHMRYNAYRLYLRSQDALDRGWWRSGILGNRPTRASAETPTLKREGL